MKKKISNETYSALGESFVQSPKKKKRPHAIASLIVLILLIVCVAFVYRQFHAMQISYEQSVFSEEAHQSLRRLNEDSTNTQHILITGSAYPDTGRLQTEKAPLWLLVTIDNTHITIKRLSSDILVNHISLYDRTSLHQILEVADELAEQLPSGEIEVLSLHFSSIRPFIDGTQSLEIISSQAIKIDETIIQAHQETLLSGRQVLQYTLQLPDDDEQSWALRLESLVTALWETKLNSMSFLQWAYYFEQASDFVETSMTWNKFFKTYFNVWIAMQFKSDYDISTENVNTIEQLFESSR